MVRQRAEPKPPFKPQGLTPPGIEERMQPRPHFEAPRYRAAGKLEGLSALVTGGDSGIGRAVAVRAAAFRMRLLAYDPVVDADFARAHGIELVDLDTLLARSDYVSLHLPLMPATGVLRSDTSSTRVHCSAPIVAP